LGASVKIGKNPGNSEKKLDPRMKDIEAFLWHVATRKVGTRRRVLQGSMRKIWEEREEEKKLMSTKASWRDGGITVPTRTCLLWDWFLRAYTNKHHERSPITELGGEDLPPEVSGGCCSFNTFWVRGTVTPGKKMALYPFRGKAKTWGGEEGSTNSTFPKFLPLLKKRVRRRRFEQASIPCFEMTIISRLGER